MNGWMGARIPFCPSTPLFYPPLPSNLKTFSGGKLLARPRFQASWRNWTGLLNCPRPTRRSGPIGTTSMRLPFLNT